MHRPSPESGEGRTAVPVRLPAGELYLVAERGQLLCQALAVVALYLDRAVSHRATGAAGTLELGRERDELVAGLRQAANHRHGLAAAVALLARDSHDAVVWEPRR